MRLFLCIAARPTIIQNRGVDVKLDIQWAFGHDQAEAMDPLVFGLLGAVEQGHSLRSAAEEHGASYRHAWGLMRQWEERLGAPLLQLQRGRGASLSGIGRCLLWAQRRAEARLAPALNSLCAEVEDELGSLLAKSTPLRMVASHDLALDQARERFAAQSQLPFSVQYRGSLDAVRQLIAGHCDLAGYHIPDLPQPGRIEARFARLLPADEFRSIHFADRNQGLILPAGNPAGIVSLQDLADKDLCFINRQIGSGTRLLFDELLTNAGIAARDIRGYEVEEFTHLAVAAMVASGAANIGFGVQAAADRFGLAFVPIVREHYLLAFHTDSRNLDRIMALVTLLKTDQGLRAAIAALSGYDYARMGEEWQR